MNNEIYLSEADIGRSSVDGSSSDGSSVDGSRAATPLIELNHVNKYYPLGKMDSLHVLKDLNLTINRGEFVMIMGKSGSGKTTLLNIIGMLDKLSTGEYNFDNRPVAGLTENEKSELRNANLGFIFQQFFLIDSLSVSQNVALPMVYKGHRDSAHRRDQARKYLGLVGIPEKEKQKTTELSGGQQQRVAIARALINDPLMIVADEPTGALDSETGVAIMDILTKLNQSGKTVVMVTHDEDLTKYASRVVYLKDGVIVNERMNRGADSIDTNRSAEEVTTFVSMTEDDVDLAQTEATPTAVYKDTLTITEEVTTC